MVIYFFFIWKFNWRLYYNIIFCSMRQAYFPPISQPEGLPLKILDAKGKEWIFQFRFWPNNNSRMYVLEGVTPCIQSMQLQAGDTGTEGNWCVGIYGIFLVPSSLLIPYLVGVWDLHEPSLWSNLLWSSSTSELDAILFIRMIFVFYNVFSVKIAQ